MMEDDFIERAGKAFFEKIAAITKINYN